MLINDVLYVIVISTLICVKCIFILYAEYEGSYFDEIVKIGNRQDRELGRWIRDTSILATKSCNFKLFFCSTSKFYFIRE